MGAQKPRLATFYNDVAIDQLYSALTQAFDLPPLQNDAGFVVFFNKVVKPCLFVLGDGAGAALAFCLFVLFCHGYIIWIYISG